MKHDSISKRLRALETANVPPTFMSIDEVNRRLRRYSRFFAGEPDDAPWPVPDMTEELHRYMKYLEEIDQAGNDAVVVGAGDESLINRKRFINVRE